jgi:hypothetical protein
MPDTTYTADQIATASRELLEAAGSEQPAETWPPEGTLLSDTYSLPEALHHLEDEIRLLRERGFTDEHIADLLTGFDIEVTPGQLTHYAPPLSMG